MQTILQLSRADHHKVVILSTVAQSLLGTDAGAKVLDKIMQDCGYYDNDIKRVNRASLGFIDNNVQLIVDFTFFNQNTGEDDPTGSFYISIKKDTNQITGAF